MPGRVPVLVERHLACLPLPRDVQLRRGCGVDFGERRVLRARLVAAVERPLDHRAVRQSGPRRLPAATSAAATRPTWPRRVTVASNEQVCGGLVPRRLPSASERDRARRPAAAGPSRSPMDGRATTPTVVIAFVTALLLKMLKRSRSARSACSPILNDFVSRRSTRFCHGYRNSPGGAAFTFCVTCVRPGTIVGGHDEGPRSAAAPSPRGSSRRTARRPAADS